MTINPDSLPPIGDAEREKLTLEHLKKKEVKMKRTTGKSEQAAESWIMSDYAT